MTERINELKKKLEASEKRLKELGVVVDPEEKNRINKEYEDAVLQQNNNIRSLLNEVVNSFDNNGRNS